ncbi:MAG TPA: hypothetical protein VJH89_01480, partial [Patescibacteria group bacterium]|nr:hypothetical protein [Patescibacteria group bacterium]
MDINMLSGNAVDTAPSKKKRFIRIILFVVVLCVIGGGVFAWKTGFVVDKIFQGNANIFRSVLKSLPGVEDTLSGEKDGRINILLLGMRGEGVTGGG